MDRTMRASLRDVSLADPLATRRLTCRGQMGGWQGAGPTQVEAERAGMDPPANVLWRGERAPAENSAGATRRGAPSDAEASPLTGPAQAVVE